MNIICIVVCKLKTIYATLTVTKIKQERTNQDKTKIGDGPFFDFLLQFSMFYLKFLT